MGKTAKEDFYEKWSDYLKNNNISSRELMEKAKELTQEAKRYGL